MSQRTLSLGIGPFFRRLFIRLLVFLLPRYGRRAIFLTTLFFEITHLSPEHERILHIINARLKIVKNPNALSFPAMLRPLVWSENPIVIRNAENIDYTDLMGLSQRIHRQMPLWTSYNDRDKVVGEIYELLSLWYRPDLVSDVQRYEGYEVSEIYYPDERRKALDEFQSLGK